MNKTDTRTLKKNHRLELVMEEAGERFEADPKYPYILKSVITPGLIVNTNMQAYELARPGMKTETGDVIAWLRSRYSWTFATALKFLQNRPPDPIQAEAQPKQKHSAPTYTQSDYGMIDKDQQKAIDILVSANINTNWLEKFFHMTASEVWHEMQSIPHRFIRIEAPEIERCGKCETPFNWDAMETYACAPLHEANIQASVGNSRDEEEKFEKDFGNISIDIMGYWGVGYFDPGSIWLMGDDDEEVICPRCAGKERKKYQALAWVRTSAIKRKKAREEERRQLEREIAREIALEEEREQERLELEYMLALEVPPDA